MYAGITCGGEVAQRHLLPRAGETGRSYYYLFLWWKQLYSYYGYCWLGVNKSIGMLVSFVFYRVWSERMQ